MLRFPWAKDQREVVVRAEGSYREAKGRKKRGG